MTLRPRRHELRPREERSLRVRGFGFRDLDLCHLPSTSRASANSRLFAARSNGPNTAATVLSGVSATGRLSLAAVGGVVDALQPRGKLD